MKKCKRCGTTEKSTRHHVYPVRWNKTNAPFPKEKQGVIVRYCRECHDSLERIIAALEKEYGKLSDHLYETLSKHY